MCSLFHRIIVVLVFVSTAVVTAGHVMSHDLVSIVSSGKQIGFQHNLYKLFHINHSIPIMISLLYHSLKILFTQSFSRYFNTNCLEVLYQLREPTVTIVIMSIMLCVHRLLGSPQDVSTKHVQYREN